MQAAHGGVEDAIRAAVSNGDDAAKLLDDTLQEEIKADQLLTKLAMSSVNKKAA